jgi:hypothetical protein
MSRSRDDDDFIFGNKGFGNDEELKQKYLERINRIEDESLESTYRALRSLNETEKIGAETAAVCYFSMYI